MPPRQCYQTAKNVGLRNVNEYAKMIELIGVSCSLSTADCESSFSTLKQVLSPQRMSVLHSRKTDLMIISFERDIAGKINSDGGAATPHLEFWPRRPSATSAVLGYVVTNLL
jgi:hypothetical protein